ncbi:MAG: response regulator [bacterium]|nr:response regulator [bacterium]
MSCNNNKNILIIDDDISVVSITTRIIERFNYHGITALDGESGLEILRDRCDEICLVILDLSMPGMDGYSVLLKIKEANYPVPVLIISGLEEDAAELIARNEFKFMSLRSLGKPYDMNALIRVVQELA